MPLDLAALQILAATCAPAVAPATLLAIGKVESGFDPLVIGVNGPMPRRLSFATPAAAAAAARRLIADGANVDLGLGQINVRNLARLGLSVEAAFEPCRNLGAAAQVLVGDYQRAAPAAGHEQEGLLTALSYYNTGRPDRGFANGYVAKVAAAAGRIVPALAAPETPPRHPPAPPPRERPPWAVFGAPTASAFVITPANGVSP
ncbi:lytic transglycosylase domain-containing protein [Phenylobacterium sp.]|uniref:lytic transglycosylase domain-containing protein n=1 Tax=Phenylobacterium sp. TaxID=1871053 RepID=UPI0035668115